MLTYQGGDQVLLGMVRHSACLELVKNRPVVRSLQRPLEQPSYVHYAVECTELRAAESLVLLLFNAVTSSEL